MTLKQLLGLVLVITGAIFLFFGLRDGGWVPIVIGVIAALLGAAVMLIKPPKRR